jgi:hypothetical protein
MIIWRNMRLRPAISITLQASGQHPVLGLHHVVVIVARERGVQPVARLGTVAVAKIVGRNDVVAFKIERLPGTKQFVAERGAQQGQTAAAGSVKQHHRIHDVTVLVPCRRAERVGIHGDRRQRLACAEAEISQFDRMLFSPGLPVFGVRAPHAEHGHDECECEQNPHGALLFICFDMLPRVPAPFEMATCRNPG